MATFKGLLLEEKDGKVTSTIQVIDDAKLPEGDVTVAVKYSTVNYKDGMVINGQGRLVRDYPHIPGIDFSGVVEESSSPDYKPGDEVILTGWRVGEVWWGGHAQKARVKCDWLVPVPKGLDLKRAMALGTAGFTAMLAIMTLEEHGLDKNHEGEVLVTGGSGGVGSVAVAILANLGYRVAASTGRKESHAYLKDLGAVTIVDRAELEEAPKGPLGRERWSGAIDTVGGTTLHTVLATLYYWSTCASVGLAASPELKTTVLPFLLRGCNLCGIDSATCSKERRIVAWNRIAKDLPMDKLDAMTETAALADLPDLATKILKGQVRGRTVIDVNA
ncbi:MAG: MDR family oxidoreductase [Rhodospirillaceae bacterium]